MPGHRLQTFIVISQVGHSAATVSNVQCCNGHTPLTDGELRGRVVRNIEPLVVEEKIHNRTRKDNSLIRYFWDFYGPMGHGTAEHFHHHLVDFLNTESLGKLPSGVEAYGPLHSAAWCEAPEAAGELISQRLRPRRAIPAHEFV